MELILVLAVGFRLEGSGGSQSFEGMPLTIQRFPHGHCVTNNTTLPPHTHTHTHTHTHRWGGFPVLASVLEGPYRDII